MMYLSTGTGAREGISRFSAPVQLAPAPVGNTGYQCSTRQLTDHSLRDLAALLQPLQHPRDAGL